MGAMGEMRGANLGPISSSHSVAKLLLGFKV